MLKIKKIPLQIDYIKTKITTLDINHKRKMLLISYRIANNITLSSPAAVAAIAETHEKHISIKRQFNKEQR